MVDDDYEPNDLLDFTPLKNFFCDQNQTHYIAGLGYTALTDQLKKLVEEWVAQGLVSLGKPKDVLNRMSSTAVPLLYYLGTSGLAANSWQWYSTA